MANYNTKCIYPGCRLKCSSKKVHRARYANITKNKGKNKIKTPSNKINWEYLENIGVVYKLPNGYKNIDYKKLENIDYKVESKRVHIP